MTPASRHLDQRVEGVRGHLRRRAAIALSLWALGGIGVVLVLAWWMAGPDGWRQGSEGPVLFDALILGWIGGSVWLYRKRAEGWFAEAPLARSIENASGLKPGMLKGSLELSRSLPAGVSSTLVGRAAERVSEGLGSMDPGSLAGELGDAVSLWTRRGLGVLTALVVVLVGLAIASPERTTAAWASLGRPLSTMRDPVLAPMVVSPGDVEVLRGADVQVGIDALGRFEVTIFWQAAGDIARSRVLVIENGRASHLFPSVGAPIEYRVVGDRGVEVGPYRIVPIDPLFVSDLVVSVTYPAYTGLSPDEYRGNPPDLRLPEGSRLIMEGRASRELSEALLVDSAGAPGLALDVEGMTFRGEWTPRRSGRFDWAFTDNVGDPAEIQPDPLNLAIVPDSAPRIAIPLPGRDTVMPINLQQPLVLEAGDDWGLDRLELVAYRVTAFGDRREPIVQGLSLGGTRAAMARPLLDVRSWGLMPGDTVRYFARVTDNSPGRQQGVTPEYVLRMPAAAEMQRAAEEQLDDVASRLEELAEEAARQAQENQDAARENAARSEAENQGNQSGQEEAAFQEQEDLAQALSEQEALSAEVDSLRAELGELEQRMEEAGQADPELARQLEELQELLKEMNGTELQQRMDELSDALEQDDVQQANQSLEEMAAEQDALRERLEESLEQFKRAAVEQDFRATTQEAEELARQERALADAMREEDQPEMRAEQQMDLEQQAQQLEEQMDRLEERLGEIDESKAAEGVQKAREQMQEAREQMQQAGQKADQGQNQEAGDQADEAASELEDVAKELQEAQQQMQQQQAEAAREALLQTGDDALALARRQADLRQRMRGASQEQVAGMRGDEASLLQGVRNIAENLQIATQGASDDNRAMSAQMGRAMESIQNTIEAMESRRGAAPSPFAQAEQAIGDLNQLAMMAIAGADQSGQSGEGQAGEQEMSEQLEQLAQQQGEVMNQTGQMMPMELGQEAMSEQMQEIAESQESVADELGEMADEPGSEDTLGDLDAMAAEAQALAEEMARGRLTPEMMQRQERLFHRLLDAGRSLEREEFSEERESEEPGTFERGQVVPLSADQLGALRFELPDAAQLRALSPAVRQLVIQYFEKLNRGGGGGGL